MIELIEQEFYVDHVFIVCVLGLKQVYLINNVNEIVVKR